MTFENAYSTRLNPRKSASSITNSPRGSHPTTANQNGSRRSNKISVAPLQPNPSVDHDTWIETAAHHEFTGLKPIEYDISLFNDDNTLKNLKKLMIQDQNRFNSDQLDFLGNKGSYDFGTIKPRTFQHVRVEPGDYRKKFGFKLGVHARSNTNMVKQKQ